MNDNTLVILCLVLNTCQIFNYVFIYFDFFTEVVWDKNSFSEADTVSGPHVLINRVMVRE